MNRTLHIPYMHRQSPYTAFSTSDVHPVEKADYLMEAQIQGWDQRIRNYLFGAENHHKPITICFFIRIYNEMLHFQLDLDTDDYILKSSSNNIY